jgi:hypothetical protein
LLGQIVVAKLSTAGPADIADLKQKVRAACRAKLAPYKVPAKIELANGPFYTSRQKKNRRSAAAA